MGSMTKLHQSISGEMRFTVEFKKTARQRAKYQPERKPLNKKEKSSMNALPAILSILAAAAAVTQGDHRFRERVNTRRRRLSGFRASAV